MKQYLQIYARCWAPTKIIGGDDETGYFFKEMKDIVNDIAVYFGETPLDDERSSVFEKPKPGVIFTKDSGL